MAFSYTGHSEQKFAKNEKENQNECDKKNAENS